MAIFLQLRIQEGARGPWPPLSLLKLVINKKAIRISIAYRPLETCLRGGGEGGGVLSSNFVYQMCHRGGP